VKLSHTSVLTAVAVAPLAALAFALVSQHVFDMQPCPWCVLQRLIYVTISATAFVGLAWRTDSARAIVPSLLVLLGVAGVATALWQNLVAAASASCNLTFADRVLALLQLDAWLPEVFQPRASCAEAAVKLLGIYFELWSAGLFTLLTLAALWLLVRRRALRGGPL
jgi:disulfide bond formation protein DsbB